MFKKKRLQQLKPQIFGWENLEEYFPEPLQAREGCTFTFATEKVGKKTKGFGYLVGGIGERVATEVYKLDISNKLWVKVSTESQEYGVPRFNHSTVFYKNKLFVFAGETINNNNFSSRTILNDMKALDLEDGVWTTISPGKHYI